MGNQIKILGADGQPLRLSAEAFIAASQSNSDLRNWHPRAGSADSDYLPEQGRIVPRSRDLERNHGVAHGARQTHHDNILGRGLRLSAKPNWTVLGKDEDWAETWGDLVEAQWQTWWGAVSCDAAETLVGDSLSSQVFNSAFLNGEAVALPLWLPGRGYRFNTCLQVIEPDRLSNPMGRADTDRLRGGIEIDEYGRPLYYWIRKVHPGDIFTGFGTNYGGYGSSYNLYSWERIPARSDWGRRRVIHANVSREVRPGQTRGVPELVSVMRQFKVLGDLTNAELKASVVNAMIAVFTESALGQEALVELLSNNPDALKSYQDGLANRGRGSIDGTGGLIIPLKLGEKVSSFSSNRPNTSFDPFVTSLFRHIATGLNIPYELLLKDFSKTNYSSARASLNEAWRFFRGRRKWLATYWCTPVYMLWLEEAVNMGLIEAPGFYENWEAYCRCFWIGDGRGYVDPLKEQQASRGRMEDNTSTLEAECADQGEDWKHVLNQRARELKEMKRLEEKYGIRFPTGSQPSAAALAPTDGVPGQDTTSGGGTPGGDGGAPAAGARVEEEYDPELIQSLGAVVAEAISAQPAPHFHFNMEHEKTKKTVTFREDGQGNLTGAVVEEG